MTAGPRLIKHLTGGQITIVDTPPTCSTKPKPRCLALEWAQDEVMRIYGRHLEMEVKPFQDYL